jgi:hypothetical protein
MDYAHNDFLDVEPSTVLDAIFLDICIRSRAVAAIFTSTFLLGPSFVTSSAPGVHSIAA